MINRVIFLLLLFISTFASAGADICNDDYAISQNESCNQFAPFIDHIDNDINVMMRSIELRLLELDSEIEESKPKAFEVQELRGDLGKLENTLWLTFQTILIIVGILATLGTLFIIRENRIQEKQHELEEKKFDLRKKELDEEIRSSLKSSIDKSILKLDKQLDIEFEVFRRKLILHEAILTKNVDEGSIYEAVRYMDQHPSKEYTMIYLKLRQLDIKDHEIRKAIENALDKADKIE